MYRSLYYSCLARKHSQAERSQYFIEAKGARRWLSGPAGAAFPAVVRPSEAGVCLRSPYHCSQQSDRLLQNRVTRHSLTRSISMFTPAPLASASDCPTAAMMLAPSNRNACAGDPWQHRVSGRDRLLFTHVQYKAGRQLSHYHNLPVLYCICIDIQHI